METLTFKGVNYGVEPISSKAEFDRIYQELLRRVNSGKSILKDLEKAYRISANEVYLIRYEQERRALVPVRIAKESVDGLLIKNRYDDKERKLQQGIGQEMAKHTQEHYEAVDRKRQMEDRTSRQLAEKREMENRQFEIDGTNFAERLVWHHNAIAELREMMRQDDPKYREDRDYKGKVDMAFDRINRAVEAFETALKDIERDNGAMTSTVRQVLPNDISKDSPPEGFVRMLQTYLAIIALNGQLEKEWMTLGDYVIDFEGLPVKAGQFVGRIIGMIERTKMLTAAAERILFPENFGYRRHQEFVYDFTKMTSAVVGILLHRE